MRLALVASLDKAATAIYDWICGVHPNLHPWHWQWTSGRPLYRDLRKVLSTVTGRVLDVGCGAKPYLPWFRMIEPTSIVGIDLEPGLAVDLVILEGQPWPIADASFDMVLCTQVIEHVPDVEFLLGQIHRVLEPGGHLVVTVPFLYMEHGAPRDYRRFSKYEMNRLLGGSFEIIQNQPEGGIGSTVCCMLLSWIHTGWNRRSPARMLKIPLLPLWLFVTTLANGLAIILDSFDKTSSFYSNVMVLARKRPVEL
jgi:SAM-dependent methyltransferase